MKKFTILLFTALLASAPVSFAQSGKQSLPEEKVVSFDSKTHDFGDVLLSDGPVSCQFVMTNISNNPIVIHNVVSSCGCTVPDYDKQPIMPGKSTTIDVTFSNDQGPYPFNKTITVYVSDVNRPIVLRIKGQSHERKKTLEELYKISMGPVSVRSRTVDMGYIAQTKRKTEEAEIANMTDKAVQVTAVADPAVTVTISPNPIPPRTAARVKYVVNTNNGPTNWGKTSYIVRFRTDGVLQDGEVTLNATINDNFDNMTKRQINNAPMVKFESTYCELREVSKGAVMNQSFKIANTGATELIIHKIDIDGDNCKVTTKMPVTVKPGGTATVNFTFDASKGGEGETINVLTLITNSASKPQANFFVTANIVK